MAKSNKKKEERKRVRRKRSQQKQQQKNFNLGFFFFFFFAKALMQFQTVNPLMPTTHKQKKQNSISDALLNLLNSQF